MEKDICVKIKKISEYDVLEDVLVLDNTDIYLTDMNDFRKTNITISTDSNISGDGSRYLGSYADKISRTIKARIVNNLDFYQQKLSTFLAIHNEYEIEIFYNNRIIYAYGRLSKYSADVNMKKELDIIITFVFPNPYMLSKVENITQFSAYQPALTVAQIYQDIHTNSSENIGCDIHMSSTIPIHIQEFAVTYSDNDQVVTVFSIKFDVVHSNLYTDIFFTFSEGFFNIYGITDTGMEDNLMKYIEFNTLNLSNTKILIAGRDISLYTLISGNDSIQDTVLTYNTTYRDNYLII